MVFEELEKLFNLGKIFNDIEKKGDEILKEFSSNEFSPIFREPSSEISEEGNEVKIKYELPGIAKEDINLKVSPNYIKIIAKTKQEEIGNMRIFERYTKFQSQKYFDYEVIPEKTKTKYKDGILEVILQKSEKKNSKINIE